MLAFFKSSATKQSTSPADSEKHDNIPADIAVEPTLVQDAPASDPPSQPAHQAEGRTSSASIPTIESASTIQGPPVDTSQTQTQPRPIPLPDSPKPAASLAPPSPVNPQGPAPSVHTQSSSQSDHPMQSQSQSALPYSTPDVNPISKDPRRFSFPSFSFLRSDAKQNKSDKKSKASRTFSILGGATSSEKRTKESAAIIRAVIVGTNDPPCDPKQNKIRPVSKFDVARVKSQLLDPKTAAKVITHLRTLPLHPNDGATNINVPIHAVCLDVSEKDLHEQYFARVASVTTATASTISAVLADLHLVDLLTAPSMGFGAPVTAQGLFAGSVPTPEAVIDGIEQITPQLMALGYATGKSMVPDHRGVIVPVDRISALTYWWGLEICLPPPTIAHLEAAESPGTALLNLLTALSVLNEGVREILPFIRYISQFVQCQWSMIKRADEGKGVVCTATWLLPVALVPCAWDFPDSPPPHTEPAAVGQSRPTSPSVKRFSATLATPKPSMEVPSGAPRSSSAYSADTRDEEESRQHAISSEPPVLPELVVSSPGSIDGAPPESVHGDAHNPYGKVQHDGEAIAH